MTNMETLYEHNNEEASTYKTDKQTKKGKAGNKINDNQEDKDDTIDRNYRVITLFSTW